MRVLKLISVEAGLAAPNPTHTLRVEFSFTRKSSPPLHPHRAF